MTQPLVESYARFWSLLARTTLAPLCDELRATTLKRIAAPKHGDAQRWFSALAALPNVDCTAHLDRPAVTAMPKTMPNSMPATETRAELARCLHLLEPWRKGPFDLAGVAIDAEWRSDRKWRRIAPSLGSLQGACALDVGAGNGYYALRMAGLGAAVVLGVDPALLYCVQAAAALHFLGPQAAHVLPLGLLELPVAKPLFDVVLSMGVLYHQRSPIDHVQQLGAWLRPGGQLFLETLIIAGDAGAVLTPTDRYARMRNVWFVPSVAALTVWLSRCGFTEVRCVDVSVTTSDEQRSTEWMRFESLREALDPSDSMRTVEGLPAPQRAVFTATKPPTKMPA